MPGFPVVHVHDGQPLLGPQTKAQSLSVTVPTDQPYLPVAAPDQQAAAAAPAIIRDLTNARQKLAFPSGAKWVLLIYRLLPGATPVVNQFAKAVINAVSDADANGKLAADASFAICQGDSLMIPAPDDDRIYRLDLIADQAVGAEKTLLAVVAGV